MSIVFHAASGSPYAWRVWLALEYKEVAYELRLHELSAGDTLAPAFVALNPRRKVPVLVDDGYVLAESAAILEYLDERFPEAPLLFPGDARARATVRRFVREIDEYLGPASRRLVHDAWFQESEARTTAALDADVEQCHAELRYFDGLVGKGFLAGPLSAADFSLYPRVALLQRLERSMPQLDSARLIPADLRRWMARLEQLPFFARAYPPYWTRTDDGARNDPRRGQSGFNMDRPERGSDDISQ
ncbi:MAG: glutathione S-transferase family protein [Polaromonas sp.]|nr:glutathione S-transferase family protein [Polaromonas sp.]